MDGILIPIAGFLVGIVLGCLCAVFRSLRRFILPALVSPFLTSIALLFGVFMLADMNPAREYGSAYIPSGNEHDPTMIHYICLVVAVIAVASVSAWVSYLIQKGIVGLAQTAGSPQSAFGDRNRIS